MIIKDVEIYNANSHIPCADIHIKDGKITKIISKNNKSKKFAVPGFIDTHIHGLFNHDVMEGKNAVEIISKHLSYNGVTSFMPTAMTNSWEQICNSLQEISLAESCGSKILGIHIEGPFIGEAKKGAHKKEYLLKGTKPRIKMLMKAANNKLKKISFDPKMVNVNLLNFLKENDIIASIGHSDADYNLAKSFFDNGCYSVCHLWNAMSGIDSRKPGILEATLNSEGVYAEMILDLFHICAESIKFTIKNIGIDNVIAVSDAIKPAYFFDGDNISGDIPVEKKGLKIVLKGTNTIAGSGITLIDAFKNIVSLGYSMNDAVKVTSYNTAKYLKRVDLGRIEVGATADIVILNKSTLDVNTTFIDGKEVKKGL